MLCCVLGADWRELEVALERLVSLEREASTGDRTVSTIESFRSALTLNVECYVTDHDVMTFTVQTVVYIGWNASSCVLNAGISLRTLRFRLIT